MDILLSESLRKAKSRTTIAMISKVVWNGQRQTSRKTAVSAATSHRTRLRRVVSAGADGAITVESTHSTAPNQAASLARRGSTQYNPMHIGREPRSTIGLRGRCQQGQRLPVPAVVLYPATVRG